MLTGPRRSGRSLLARGFVDRVGGRLFDGADKHDEEELFHAWNAAQDSGQPIVMIVDEVPPAWEITLARPSTRALPQPRLPGSSSPTTRCSGRLSSCCSPIAACIFPTTH